MLKTITLNDVVKLADQLSLLDKVRLIERIAPGIERDLATTKATPKRSLWGAFAYLGPAPSSEEIDEARREMWANFPREDI